MAERIRLTADLEALFPSDVITIGNQPIEIKALGFGKIMSLVRKLNALGPKFKEAGIDWENYNQQSNIIALASILLEQAPEIISEVSNIHEDDIPLLPLDKVVEILSVALEVNLKSKESLEKNFARLAEKVGQNQVVIPKSPKRSKS